MTFPLVCKCLLDRRTRRPGSCTIQVAEMNAVLPTEGRESRKPLLGVHSKRLKDLRARDKAAGGRKCLSSSRQSGSVLPGRAPNASGGKRLREDEPHARGMRTTDATKCNVDLQIRGNPDIVNSVVVDVVPCVSDRNFEITGRCWESIWAAGVASCRKPGSRSRRFETTHHKARDMLKNVSLFYCTLTEGRFRLADRPFLFCAPAFLIKPLSGPSSPRLQAPLGPRAFGARMSLRNTA